MDRERACPEFRKSWFTLVQLGILTPGYAPKRLAAPQQCTRFHGPDMEAEVQNFQKFPQESLASPSAMSYYQGALRMRCIGTLPARGHMRFGTSGVHRLVSEDHVHEDSHLQRHHQCTKVLFNLHRLLHIKHLWTSVYYTGY